MLVYYCNKCQTLNPESVCDTCGKNLPGTAMRFIWTDVCRPVLDSTRVLSVFRNLLYAELLLLLFMLVVEYIQTGSRAFSFFAESGILPVMVIAYLAGCALGLLLLLFQGSESVQYVLDPKGALKRTWIEPSRIRCWSRFLKYDERAIQTNAEGVPFMMAHEQYVLYSEVARYTPHPIRGRIALYRPYAFLFMDLRIPRDEYEQAAAMLAAKLKKKATR